jgi:hypothetical protein
VSLLVFDAETAHQEFLKCRGLARYLGPVLSRLSLVRRDDHRASDQYRLNFCAFRLGHGVADTQTVSEPRHTHEATVYRSWAVCSGSLSAQRYFTVTSGLMRRYVAAYTPHFDACHTAANMFNDLAFTTIRNLISWLHVCSISWTLGSSTGPRYIHVNRAIDSTLGMPLRGKWWRNNRKSVPDLNFHVTPDAQDLSQCATYNYPVLPTEFLAHGAVFRGTCRRLVR